MAILAPFPSKSVDLKWFLIFDQSCNSIQSYSTLATTKIKNIYEFEIKVVSQVIKNVCIYYLAIRFNRFNLDFNELLYDRFHNDRWYAIIEPNNLKRTFNAWIITYIINIFLISNWILYNIS